MDGHLTDYLDVMSMTTVAANLQPLSRNQPSDFLPEE
jgi:hypothetical protein